MADNLAPAPRLGGKPGESNMANAAAGLPPSNITAAPTPANVQTGTGLCAAINAYYAEQAINSGFIPDVYEIVFADPILGNASMIPKGPKEKEFTGATAFTSASSKLDPAKQSAPLQVRTRGTTAGQQIIQFIDQVLRSSRYIGDQQNVTWNNDTNSWDPQGKAGQVFAWYNIVSNAIPLQYDPARNDFAYRLIFTITPYQTPIQSEYFNGGVFRGVHKVYNYWFTGQNTQVLQYEQNFNTLWTQAITGDITTANIRNTTNPNMLWKKAYLPASNQTRQGGTGKTFEPAANAADILYTNDYAKIKLSIIGDPAWIPSVVPLTSGAFYSSPFNPDGSINSTASPPYFKFAWNRPEDYNLDTGLMDPGAANFNSNRLMGIAGDAQESVAYIAAKCHSSFKNGKFTQEIEGTWIQDLTNISGTTSQLTAGTSSVTAVTGATIATNNAATATTVDSGRNTDPTQATTVVNTVSGATSRIVNNVGTTVVNATNSVLQAGVNSLKQTGTTALTNFVKPYEAQVQQRLTSAGNWLANSVTSIGKPVPQVPVPPVSLVATVGQTNEFGGLESPPTLAVKPGESETGVYNAGISQPDPLPDQGIVQDDQGP